MFASNVVRKLNIRCAVLVLLLLSASVTSYGFDYLYKGVIFRCKPNGDNSVAIKSWKVRAMRSVTVPATVKDEGGREYNVTSLDVYVSGDSYSTERIVIEEGVSRIEDRCFHEFFKLKSVVVPSSMKYIGVRAFGNVKSSNINSLFAESTNCDIIVQALVNSNYKGALYLSDNNVAGTAKTSTLETTPSAPTSPSHGYVTGADMGTPVVRVRSFTKSDNSIEAVRGKMFDHSNRHCALVKVTMARYRPSYSGSDIPEPILNYINYNVRGRDHVWMASGATSLNVYSADRDFEPATVVFREVSGGKIPKLESGCVYELQLRVEYER